jgi:dTDP-glucose pyrophosphorylase
MTVMITMAGLGSRFKEKGYVPPKFRILARGRTLMDWSLSSLQAFFEQRFIFACLDQEEAEWIRSTAAASGITDVVIAKRPSVSRGQAETAFDALTHAEARQPLWIYNIDTCVSPNLMRPQDLGTAAGCIPVFDCSQPNMSFVRYGSGDEVVEVAEKQPISSWATVGLYGFRSAARFAELYQEAYERGRIPMTQGERYVAPLYELMLLAGERVVAPRLATKDVHILGTPAEVLAFDPAAQPPFGNTQSA